VAAVIKSPCDEVLIGCGPDQGSVGDVSGRWILAATILGSSMIFIDGAVVNVALPVLQVELNATLAQVQWVVQSYALLLASLILVGGSLGDRYGRRLVFGIGTAVFASSSAWCGIAPDIGQLIAARGLQGIGGALMVPGSLALISSAFGGERRARAIGLWSGFTSVSSGIGPVAGGYLVGHFSWRWAFLINIPLAAVVLIITLTRIPETGDGQAPHRLDFSGALTATLGLGALVYGLTLQGSLGWESRTVIGFVLAGVALLAFFIAIEARSQAPMMPLTLFRSRTFSGANLLTLFLYAALSGALFFLPFDLIQVQGYTPAQTGAALVPFIIIMFLLSRWASNLVTRYGPRPPLAVGPVIAACGFALLALPGAGGTYWFTFFPAVVVIGLGMVTTVAPLTTTVMGSVPISYTGVASAINNAVSRTGGLLALAFFGLVMSQVFSQALEGRLTRIDLSAGAKQSLLSQRGRLTGMEIPPDISPEARAALRSALNESFIAGFRAVVYCAAGLSVLGALVAFVMIEGRPAPSLAMETDQGGGVKSAEP
jgi:EmrB/QacA subfamily drug resistance transporter